MAESPVSSSVGSTSSSLLRRVKEHQQDAWRNLVRLYGPLVDYWLRYIGLQAADKEDIFQEVFRAVARNIGQFRKDQPDHTFRGWLRIITRSKIADHFRKLGNQPQAIGGSDVLQRLHEIPLPVDSESDPGEETQLDALRLRALDLVRSEFETRTWQAFWRVTVDGHEVRDVAADLGVSTSAVRLAKSRVLRRLREEMEGLEP